MKRPSPACAVCGCTETAACVDDLRGACWWVEPEGKRPLCSHCAEPDSKRYVARRAAQKLIDAAGELLRYSREGDQEAIMPFSLEPTENVADALRTILQIERSTLHAPAATDPDEHDQLIAALARFLEGWA